MTSGGRSSARAVRLDSLTGLRFFAAMAVFLHHATAYQSSPAWAGFITNAGDNGVSFFFMLSGFVLAWSARDRDTVGRFYQRRAARILPLYWLAWLPGAIYAVVIDDARLINQIPSLLLVQSWYPQKDVHFAANSVGWSLSTELFFYLLFPFFFLLIKGLNKWVLAAILVGAVTVVIAVPLLLQPLEPAGSGYWAIYLLPATRFFEFAAGVVLALLLRSGLRIRIPVAVAGLLAVTVSVGANWLPLYALLVAATVIPFVLLIGAAAESDMQGRRTLLTWGPIVKLGQWSFAFYLVHLLVLRVVIAMNEHSLHLPWWGTTLVSLIAGTALAAVLFEYVEKPLENRLRPRPLLAEGNRASATVDRVA
jgi:peptidoglycan/LPS O-acetylase OafA/YrhL